jgi:hypothetical protein
MRCAGREGGTLDEMTASAWVAERARAAGLQPAGDNGTYFQFFPLERFRVSPSSLVTLGGKKLVMGRDIITNAVVLADVDAPVARYDSAAAVTAETTPANFKGKAVVVTFTPPPPAPNSATAAAPVVGPGAQAALRNWLLAIQRAIAPANGENTPAAIIAIVPDDQKGTVGARRRPVSARHLRPRS